MTILHSGGLDASRRREARGGCAESWPFLRREAEEKGRGRSMPKEQQEG